MLYRDIGMEIEDAVDASLEEMPNNFEIKGFLLENRAEVKSMCITEYNEEETMEMFRKEYLEEGRAEGREEGVKAIVEICKEYGGSAADAVEKIVTSMGMTKSEADRLVEKYWIV